MRRLLILCVWCLVLASFASAELNVTTFVSFQGKLANKTTGNAFTNASLQINITTYNNLSDVKWGPYNFSNVTDSQGVFDMVLGRTYDLNLMPGMRYNLVVAADLNSANFSSADDIYGDKSPTVDEIIVNAGHPGDASQLRMDDNVTSVQTEFTKYAKLTGANFTGKVNVSENLNVGGNLSLIEINLTEKGNVEAIGNFSLGQKITFALGEVIDNLINNWVKVTGSLNVTGDIHTPGGIVVGGAPAAAVAGTLRFTNNIFQGYNGSEWLVISNGSSAASPWSSSAGNVYYTSGNVGIGVSSPSSALNVSGNIGTSGNVTATMFIGNGSLLTGVVTSGGTGEGMWLNNTAGVIRPNESYGKNVNISGNLTIDHWLNITGTSGEVVTAGNVTAAMFFGDGSLLSGLENVSINYGNNGSEMVPYKLSGDGTLQIDVVANNADDLICVDCIGANEISDVYVLNTGDTVAGNLIVNGSLNVTNVTYFGSQAVANIDASGNIVAAGNLTVNNSVLFVNRDSGNIGVGTASPSQPLDVDGNVRIGYNGGANAYLEVRTGTDDTTLSFFSNTDTQRWELRDDEGKFELNEGLNTNNRITVLSGGNVGIGTTTPNYLLSVADTTGAGLSMNVSDVLYVNGSSGNVGIGTTNPLSKLSVNGVGNSNYAIYGNATTSSGPGVYGNGYYGVQGVGTFRGIYGIGETFGVYGEGAYGVSGVGTDVGVYGDGISTGIYGYATSATATSKAVRGKVVSPNGWSGYFEGGKGIFVDGNVGIGTVSPGASLEISGVHAGSGITQSLVIDDTWKNPTSGGGREGISVTVNSNNTGGGNIDITRGIEVNDPTLTGAHHNLVGIGIAEQTAGTHNVNLYLGGVGGYNTPAADYSLYSTSTKDSYFAGNVGIGTTSPGSKLVVAGNINVSGCYYNSSDAAFTGSCADIAELFPVESNVKEADVVCLKPSGKAGHCNEEYDTNILGVISTSPAIIIEGENIIMGRGNYSNSKDKLPIALKGKVPVKVICTPEINQGDLLVSSSKKGYAQSFKAKEINSFEDVTNTFGTNFGKALESCSEAESIIMAWID